MKKRSIILVSYLFSIIFLISFISAGIYFSDLNSKYNLGDMIDLNVRIDPLEEGLLLNAILFCNDAPVIEFNNFPNEEGNVNIKLPLNFNTINQANGNCYFSGTYNSESQYVLNSNETEVSGIFDFTSNNTLDAKQSVTFTGQSSSSKWGDDSEIKIAPAAT